MTDDSTLLRHEDDIKGLTVLMNGIDKSVAVLSSKMDEVLGFVKNLRELGIDVKVLDLMQRMQKIEEEHDRHKLYIYEKEAKHKRVANFFMWGIPTLIFTVLAFVGDFILNHRGH